MIFRSVRQIFANVLTSLLPSTRCYALKRSLWQMAGVKIDHNARLVSSVSIRTTGPLAIGKNSFIGHEALILGGDAPIIIGHDVAIGPRALIVSGTHEITPERDCIHQNGTSLPIHIGNGTMVGANVTILAGVTIGKKSVIAAGAVVAKDIPDGVMAGGVPAKIIKPLSAKERHKE